MRLKMRPFSIVYANIYQTESVLINSLFSRLISNAHSKCVAKTLIKIENQLEEALELLKYVSFINKCKKCNISLNKYYIFSFFKE